MNKKLYLANDHNGRTTTAQIAQGSVDEIGIRGNECYTAEGDLIVEYYNCSDALYEALSSELCYTTLVARDDKAQIVTAIREMGDGPNEDDEDWVVLRFLQNHFNDHKMVRQWLLEQHIPFRKFFDSNWGVQPAPPDERDAERLARLAHTGQKDKAGADYIAHPLRVMQSFSYDQLAEDNYAQQRKIGDLRIIALLHDTLEDTWVTGEYLERSGYAPHIITAIEALIKQPDEKDSDAGYEKFIRRAAQNPLARQVKIADLKDNMDLSRLAEPTAKDAQRIERYKKALVYLELFRDNDNTPGETA